MGTQPVTKVIVPTNKCERIFNKQKSLSLGAAPPSIEIRKRNLMKLETLLLDNQDDICAAISADFGNRPFQETKLLELFLSVDGIRDCRKRLKKWIKPQKRKGSIWFFGAKNSVIPQPKGVVGIIAPWNYPLLLVMGPLTNALAAGNRCMIKMSANSNNLCILLDRLIGQYFDESVVSIIPDISGSDFCKFNFDHIVFTGSGNTGRRVMEAASKHLTPITLELGGKSPVIIADDFNLEIAAERVLQMKTVNAGQTCVAPDYVFVPRNHLDEFVCHCKRIAAKRYNSIESADYTSMIDEHAYEKMTFFIQDAKDKGAHIIYLLNGEKFNPITRKISPCLVLNVNDEMALMKEEIFGPILPIKSYEKLDSVFSYINRRDTPLALYMFTNRYDVKNQILDRTRSGGVGINDCALHVAQHDLPFGGFGESGMGQYHGYEGFLELSKLRPIFSQFRFPAFKFLYPPYGNLFDKIMKLMLR